MTCRICGNKENNKVFQVKEMMFGTAEQFDYFECSSCQCLQIGEIPGSMDNYYPPNYYSYSVLDEAKYTGIGGKFRLLKFGSSIDRKSFPNILYHFLFGQKQFDLLALLNLTIETKILDVGAGNGEFLYPLSHLGFKNILGIDPYLSKDIVYKSGFEVLKKSIFELSSIWDVINYNHVFEHIVNPSQELAQVAKLLTSNGVCIINIPTVSSYAWKQYGVHWYQIDAPRHFYLHSIKSFEILCRLTGFKIEQVIYNSNYRQFHYSELYGKGIPMVKRPKPRGIEKIFWRYTKARYIRNAKRLNSRMQGDQFAVIIRKVNLDN